MITTPDDRPCVAPKVGDMVRLRNGGIVGPLEGRHGGRFESPNSINEWYWTGAFDDECATDLDIVEIIAQPREIYLVRSTNDGDLMVFDGFLERDQWLEENN